MHGKVKAQVIQLSLSVSGEAQIVQPVILTMHIHLADIIVFLQSLMWKCTKTKRDLRVILIFLFYLSSIYFKGVIGRGVVRHSITVYLQSIT